MPDLDPERLPPSQWPKSEISAWADKCAEKLGFTPNDPLQPIVERLNGRIVEVGISEAKSTAEASIVIDVDGSFEVMLPDFAGDARNRFTLAHEIGHYLVHYAPNAEELSGQRWSAERAGSDRLEWEANWFAAAFLMPEDAFRESYTHHDGQLVRVALDFGVSPMAAEVRAKVLNLL